MSLWESGPVDGFVKTDAGWIRISRVESVQGDDKRWGVTAKGKDVFRLEITMISGAKFSHLTTDVGHFIRRLTGDV